MSAATAVIGGDQRYHILQDGRPSCPAINRTAHELEPTAHYEGASQREALLGLADLLFETDINPAWLCPICAGQMRWWFGVAS